MTEPRIVPVGLGDRAYELIIGKDALIHSAPNLPGFFPRGRAIIITDERVQTAQGGRLKAVLSEAGLATEWIVLRGGETEKSFAGLQSLLETLLDLGVERSDSLIAFGGGVIGDLAGFAAAILKRGVDFIQIPTTLLAQVDSSVGGKTGINTSAGKNMVGAFHQPRLVIADTAFLETLPERELKAGYAEILKAALIGDAGLFERLERLGAQALQGEALARSIAEAVAFKARIVAEDERESGIRALLNLGHTFAHAFEAEAEPGALIHGEAVACGLALAFDYSARRGLIDPADAERVKSHLEETGLPANPVDLPGGDYRAQALLARMRDDKKNHGGRVVLILAKAIGSAYIDDQVDETDVLDFLEHRLK